MSARAATKIIAQKTSGVIRLRNPFVKRAKLLLPLFSGFWLIWALPTLAGDLVKSGEYVFKLAGCKTCHTDSEHQGGFLAGGRALVTPFGTFYTPNITSDLEYGLGKWSEAEFIQALSQGISPSGSHYFPVFPYPSYTRMSREDMQALWAYLRTVPAIAQPSKAHDTTWYLLGRFASWSWQLLFFSPGAWTPQPDKSTAWNRGAYIATALTHCGECHTPRNSFGVLDKSMAYAGTENGPEGTKVPNITSDPETGIGKWEQDELVDFFQEGMLPDGDYTGGLMAEVVDNDLKYLTPVDVEALATYIAALPPIYHVIHKKK
jgi:mono/diheme cytochrome c family protein